MFVWINKLIFQTTKNKAIEAGTILSIMDYNKNYFATSVDRFGEYNFSNTFWYNATEGNKKVSCQLVSCYIIIPISIALLIAIMVRSVWSTMEKKTILIVQMKAQ